RTNERGAARPQTRPAVVQRQGGRSWLHPDPPRCARAAHGQASLDRRDHGDASARQAGRGIHLADGGKADRGTQAAAIAAAIHAARSWNYHLAGDASETHAGSEANGRLAITGRGQADLHRSLRPRSPLNAEALIEPMQKFLQEEIGWHPKDRKQVREKI